LLMGKYLMAVFVRVFAQKVTANFCPIELLVRGLIHFGLYYVIPKLLIPPTLFYLSSDVDTCSEVSYSTNTF
ncbi:hypothetical protein, partial [Thalassotalea sp. SU-HH00458]|uniref:hypothetical protein n=1 Tax=Thalassotalea sp. SU-HH00458 TaxID=3127657 RepID=UPI0033656E1C